MKQATFFTPAFLVAGISFLASCTSNEIGNSKDVAQNKIHQTYRISYSEGDETCDLDCQFRFAGSNGTTLVLNAPSKVEIDGQQLKVDSSGGGGAFYRFRKPAAEMLGVHKAVFTDINGKQYVNRIQFQPFKFTDIPQAASRHQPLPIRFEAPDPGPGGYVRVESVDADTSFTGDQEGKDRFVTVPAAYLEKIKGNSISFQARLTQYIPIQEATEESGRIVIWYSLKPVKIKLQ